MNGRKYKIMSMDMRILALAKKYTDKSLLGAGAIVGKNVQVSKIEPIIGGNRVTFTYALDDGTQKNSFLDVMNGEKGDSVVSSNIDDDGNLSFVLSNGETINAGKITINSGQINLENYYTKDQVNDKFVQMMELDNLVEKIIGKNFVACTSEEINNLFSEKEGE